MAGLVTLDDAKEHLRVTIPDEDGDIYRKVEQASAIVVIYLKGATAPTWTEATVPGQIKAAVLVVLEALHERKPIDWVSVERLCMQSRDPALA